MKEQLAIPTIAITTFHFVVNEPILKLSIQSEQVYQYTKNFLLTSPLMLSTEARTVSRVTLTLIARCELLSTVVLICLHTKM